MYGPERAGYWSSIETPNCCKRHEFLRAGRRYRVLESFMDFDGDTHLAGEEWEFLGSAYLPYDDGVSFFVSLDGVREWHIRLQRRPHAQGKILDALDTYLAPAVQEEHG